MADVVVVCLIVNVLGVARPSHQARCPQQAQMVADKGLGRIDLAGDIAHSHGLVETGEQDLEAGGVTEQLECLGDDENFGFGRTGSVAQKALAAQN